MGHLDAAGDSPETAVDSTPSAETELAPPVGDQSHAWALDDGPEWEPPFWTAGRITAASVVSAVIAAIVVAGLVGYHLKSEPSATAPAPTSRTASAESVTNSSPSAGRPAPSTSSPIPSTPPVPVALSAPQGSAWVGTQSGRTFCQITAGSVICLVEFDVPTPLRYGAPANGVSVSITGDFEWTAGDRGQQPIDTLRYGTTYSALGWTIRPTSEDTTFINDTTGHGMTVSVGGVTPF